MNGDLRRGAAPNPRCVLQFFSLLALLSLFSGCSLFASRPAPPEAPVVTMPEAPLAPPAPPFADTLPDDDSRPHRTHRPARHTPKPSAPQPASEPEAVTPPPAPAARPAPLIETRTLEKPQSQALLDSEVRRPDGKAVGRAVNLIVDQTGKPSQMVVNLTGFMGVGDRKINFPWNTFRLDEAADKAQIVLLSLPTGEHAVVASPRTTVSLIDSAVSGRDGATVGRIVDVLIDRQAQPQAVVLDVGSSVTRDEHAIAADWSALHFLRKEDTELQIGSDFDSRQLKAAPPYLAGQPVLAVSPAANAR